MDLETVLSKDVMDLQMHPDQSERLKLHSRGHVKALAQHIFQNDPVGLQKVAAAFGEHTIIQPELVPEKPRDYAYHHITQ